MGEFLSDLGVTGDAEISGFESFDTYYSTVFPLLLDTVNVSISLSRHLFNLQESERSTSSNRQCGYLYNGFVDSKVGAGQGLVSCLYFNLAQSRSSGPIRCNVPAHSHSGFAYSVSGRTSLTAAAYLEGRSRHKFEAWSQGVMHRASKALETRPVLLSVTHGLL